jgi:hypothetical protein
MARPRLRQRCGSTTRSRACPRRSIEANGLVWIRSLPSELVMLAWQARRSVVFESHSPHRDTPQSAATAPGSETRVRFGRGPVSRAPASASR